MHPQGTAPRPRWEPVLASPAMRRRLRAVILLSFRARARPPGRARAGRLTRAEVARSRCATTSSPRGSSGSRWAGRSSGPTRAAARTTSRPTTARSRSADLAPGEVFDETFATEGAYPYFCSIHGSPGAGMTGLVLVGDAPIPRAASDVGPGRETRPRSRRRDPCAAGRDRSIQAAVDAAEPGGIVVISPGRLRGGGGRDDAVPHDPRSGSQPGDPGGRVHARQRDLGRSRPTA